MQQFLTLYFETAKRVGIKSRIEKYLTDIEAWMIEILPHEVTSIADAEFNKRAPLLTSASIVSR